MLASLLLLVSRIIYPLILVIVPALVFLKDRKHFFIYAVSLSLTLIVIYSTKYILGIPRPEGAEIAVFSPRFPSGHAALSFLLVGFFKKIKYRLPLLGFAVLSSYSRLYFNLHKVVDLIVGAGIGFIIPALLLAKEEEIKERLEFIPESPESN